MKKDIKIPTVSGVHVAAVHENNEEFETMDWNIYLINDNPSGLESVLVVSKGYSDKDVTSTMRYSLKELPPRSFAKLEFIQDSVLGLENKFSVSYFIEGVMYHKNFVFPKDSINEAAVGKIPIHPQEGILAK